MMRNVAVMVRSDRDSETLDQLISDCILYNLSEEEALEYIQRRFGKSISARSYYTRKKNIERMHTSSDWARDYTRTGLLSSFHQLMDSAQKQYSDIMHQLYVEQNKDDRDEYKIIKLRHDLREQGLYIVRLSDTTPVILQIRKLLSKSKD